MTISTFLSPFGPLVLVADNGVLVYCNWDCCECEPKLINSTKAKVTGDGFQERDCHILKETTKQLEEYFNGKRKCFDLPIILEGSKFRKKVWEQLLKIDYGNTVSYKNLAERCNVPLGFRAVANACGANRIAIIIPCHRIISSSGQIGGYTGGIDKKIRLLELEQQFQW